MSFSVASSGTSRSGDCIVSVPSGCCILPSAPPCAAFSSRSSPRRRRLPIPPAPTDCAALTVTNLRCAFGVACPHRTAPLSPCLPAGHAGHPPLTPERPHDPLYSFPHSPPGVRRHPCVLSDRRALSGLSRRPSCLASVALCLPLTLSSPPCSPTPG